MKWYVHSCSAIDYNWDCLPSVAETARYLGGHSAALETQDPTVDPFAKDIDGFLADWKSAQVAAASAGWEGDFARGPVVIWLPDERHATFVWAFAFKQRNNGQTYVISPFELAWLGKAVIRPPVSGVRKPVIPPHVFDT